MHDLVHDLVVLTQRNKDGSFATQANRRAMLTQMAEQLIALGYWQLRASAREAQHVIKERHVNALLTLWRQQGLSDDTIANRFAALRWWCEKVGRPWVMHKTNAVYGLVRTSERAAVSKAQHLDWEKWAQIDDGYVKKSVQLQAAFGLRCEESLKIQPWRADAGDRLHVEHGTKGGHPRWVPITVPRQREVLDDAKQFVRFKEASLIPRGMSFYQQRNRYYGELRRVGLSKLHGLRHAFAQAQYEALSGVASPVNGGPLPVEVARVQQRVLREARRQVSEALGHHRPGITTRYIG
jgi:integrase